MLAHGEEDDDADFYSVAEGPPQVSSNQASASSAQRAGAPQEEEATTKNDAYDELHAPDDPEDAYEARRRFVPSRAFRNTPYDSLNPLKIVPHLKLRFTTGLIDVMAMKREPRSEKFVPSPVFVRPRAKRKGPFRRALLVVNLFTGGSKFKTDEKEACLKLLESLLQEKSIQYERKYTQRPGHAKEIVAQCGLNPDDSIIIVFGGDGTLSECAQGLMDLPSDARPALLPLGVGISNSMALALKLLKSQKEPILDRAQRCAMAVVASRSQEFDLGKVTDASGVVKHFMLTCSWGDAAELVSDADWWKKKYNLGQWRFTLAAFRRMFKTYSDRQPINVIVDDRYRIIQPADWTTNRKIAEVTVATISRVNNYNLSPLAVADDGKFEAMCLPNRDSSELIEHAKAYQYSKMLDTEPDSKPLYLRFSKLTLDVGPNVADKTTLTKEDTRLALDGCVVEGLTFPVAVEVVPRAMRFVCAHDINNM